MMPKPTRSPPKAKLLANHQHGVNAADAVMTVSVTRPSVITVAAPAINNGVPTTAVVPIARMSKKKVVPVPDAAVAAVVAEAMVAAATASRNKASKARNSAPGEAHNKTRAKQQQRPAPMEVLPLQIPIKKKRAVAATDAAVVVPVAVAIRKPRPQATNRQALPIRSSRRIHASQKSNRKSQLKK